MRLEEKIVKRLIAMKKTLSLAESCTGGFLSHRLTNIPGASSVLKSGLVVYSNEAKIKLLKVRGSLIRQQGAVSAPVATALALQVRRLFKTDFGLGITGIAGPGGGSSKKPVGLTYIALSTAKKTMCCRHHFKGTRLQIKQQATEKALEMLQKFL